jgi:hypothetical protein
MLIRINQFSRTFPLWPQNLNYGDASPLTPTLKIIESSSLLNYNVKNIGSPPPHQHEFQNRFENKFKQLPMLTYGPLPKQVHPTCAWLTEMWLPQLPQLRPPLSGGRIPALGCNWRRGKRVCPPDLAVSGTRLGRIRVCLVCSTYMWFLFGFGKNGLMQLVFLNRNFDISNQHTTLAL